MMFEHLDREDEPYITFDRDEFLEFLRVAEALLGRTTKQIFNNLPKEVRL